MEKIYNIKGLSNNDIYNLHCLYQIELISRIIYEIKEKNKYFNMKDIDVDFFYKNIHQIILDNMYKHTLSFEDLLMLVDDFSKKSCLTCSKQKYFFEFDIDYHKKDGYKDNCRSCYENSKKLVTLSNLICSSNFCDEKGLLKYNRYCKHCFVNLFPSDSKCINYRTKEKLVCNYLKNFFKSYIKSFNKTIEHGFSKYRPDILINIYTHAIIVEIDENQHNHEDYICENKRICTIFSELGHINCVFIRFNPDKYSLKNGAIYESCFKKNKNGILEIINEFDWNNRLHKLKETIDYHIKNIPEKSITNIYLFYDE